MQNLPGGDMFLINAIGFLGRKMGTWPPGCSTGDGIGLGFCTCTVVRPVFNVSAPVTGAIIGGLGVADRTFG